MADPKASDPLALADPRATMNGGSEGSEPHPGSIERITDVALGYMSLEDKLAELLERARLALNADTAAMLLLDEERRVLVARAAKGIEEEVREGVQVPLGVGFAGRIAAECKPVVLQDVHKPRIYNPILEQKGIRSLLGVPLHVDGRVIGVMHVGTLTPRTFDDADVRLLALAAERAALAVEEAQLAEQRAITERLQRTLLPHALADFPGLRFSAKYLPAGTGIKIGGDWYDVCQLLDGRVAVVIGDVVGRGVVAAAVMSEIRTAMRAYLLEGHDLATVMSLLDELLSSMDRSRGATAAIFALDMELAELEMVSAGHVPALLIEPDGTSRLLFDGQGPPLGVGPWHAYASRRLPYPTGSVLLLYTDGLIERRGESIDCGLERLVAAADGAWRSNGLPFADRVYKRLVTNPVLEDDVALLAIESIELGPVLELTLEATPTVLAGLRRTLGRWLMRHGVADDIRFDIAVAVSEAAGNAVEHAYGPLDSTFQVSGRWSEHEVAVTVRDRGSWRRAMRLDAGRGRGLTMMRELMDTVEIERDPQGTTVHMVKCLRADA